MEPMVSVIVPVYNADKYLQRCVDSIIKQSYKQLDIVFVDDGSTDNSCPILMHYGKEDSRIRIKKNLHTGVVIARQTGLDMSVGEYVTFVDADDWLDSNMVEEMVEMALYNDAEIVSTRHYINDLSTQDKWVFPAEGLYRKGNNFADLYEHFFETSNKGFIAGLWGRLYKRNILVKYHKRVDPHIKYAEDALCTYPLLFNSDSIYVTNKCYYHYFQNPHSVSRSTNPNYYAEVNILITKLYSEMVDHPDFYKIESQLIAYVCDLLMRGIKFVFGKPIGKVYLFPQKLVKKQDRIILYGAGNVGQSYYKDLTQNGYCTLVEWVDSYSENYPYLPISGCKQILNCEYEKIIIAVKSFDVAEEIKRQLMGMGIEKHKILWNEPAVIPEAYQYL